MSEQVKKEKIMKKVRRVIEAKTDDGWIKSDVNGSYTGVPIDKSEKPIQDADDL